MLTMLNAEFGWVISQGVPDRVRFEALKKQNKPPSAVVFYFEK